MDKDVKNKLDSYPEHIKPCIEQLRQLVFSVAMEDNIGEIDECLKWGELSYISKVGSTLRIDWKSNSPEQYKMYFHCQTKLVETFKELYPIQFNFDKNRAIVFKTGDEIAVAELSHCISMTLRYHQIKHLPLLGA